MQDTDIFGIQIDYPFIKPPHHYRPPYWPPPEDWAPIVDADGIPQCFYSDSSWPLDVWSGSPLKLNFGDGRTTGARVSVENANLLRQCAAWLIWGPRACRTAGTVSSKFAMIKPLFVACTAEGILASHLMRYERVIDEIINYIPASALEKSLSVFHELLDAKDILGFCLLDQYGLARLARLSKGHEPQQTPYIPPRIWSYQISRLRECLEEFLQKAGNFHDFFRYCIEAYDSKTFSSKRTKGEGACELKIAARRFGVVDTLEQWVGPIGSRRNNVAVRMSQYFDLVSHSGLAYLMNFSLMRIKEAWNLRSDCLLIEKDEKFGDIHILCGETTKTSPDADARWPVSSSATLAVEAMRAISGWRMRSAVDHHGKGIKEADKSNPYLMSYQFEPWSRGRGKNYGTRPAYRHMQQFLDQSPLLFDLAQIKITEEDIKIARQITPELDTEKFKPGVNWHFGWHQLRRTGAVNMLSSNLLDESSIQLLLKHSTRIMTLYYGRNYSKLSLSEETKIFFLKIMYQEMARDLQNLASPQFISPFGAERKEAIVNFISPEDALSLEKSAKEGKVSARRIRAGFCVNNRPCSYGGIESINHCLGDAKRKGCPDLLLDQQKIEDIRLYEKEIDKQLRHIHEKSPRHQSLLAEKESIQIFYDNSSKKQC